MWKFVNINLKFFFKEREKIMGVYTATIKKLKIEGATGIEPVTSRSAVECSTTELCPLSHTPAVKFVG